MRNRSQMKSGELWSANGQSSALFHGLSAHLILSTIMLCVLLDILVCILTKDL